ncbi:FAD-dependent monooxygenase OpS4 [Psilocybe cubensis]|uniref:FAD-dependent monooxygenase OpS4 n=1 Tax=Psilocybe cubensis TaxID=181762 RepID=A0ACB8GFR6_PSICU|nr:FAD-dependent monooxygenase OpS4 [Psilocybe cubensis]KAH9474459.1 FAD-dependent monooxygenase OpS4 [Psilocybe cubensis]
MTRILYRWGLKAFMDQVSEKTGWSREGLIGTINYDDELLQDQISEFRFLRTQTLEDKLQELVDNEAIRVIFGTVINITTVPNMPAKVIVGEGSIINADFVICADGYDSAFKDFADCEIEEGGPSWPNAHLVLAFAIPISAVREDEALRSVFQSSTQWNIWVGNGFVVHANVSDGGEFVRATMTANYNRDIFLGDQTWKVRRLEYWGIDFDLFEPRVKKLLSLAESVSSRVFMGRPVLNELVCVNSKIVLVGDAAHPILPGGNQHIALAIEEAETLRCIFTRIQHRSQIPELLVAYEEIRLPRTSHIIKYERGMHLMMKIPNGPQQEERDAKLKQVMAGDWDHMDEELFRAIFGEEFQQYSHDATEEVEDWWTKWGPVISKRVLDREC